MSSNRQDWIVEMRPRRSGQAFQAIINALNPPEARMFAEARYPGYEAGGVHK